MLDDHRHPATKPDIFPSMKTIAARPALSLLFAAAALGAFAASTFAGPGPQYWNRPNPAAKSTAPAAQPAAKCAGCTTTTQWTGGDRGPAGKGAAGTKVASRTHSCSACTGTVVTAQGRATDTMIHPAACATLVCCK